MSATETGAVLDDTPREGGTRRGSCGRHAGHTLVFREGDGGRVMPCSRRNHLTVAPHLVSDEQSPNNEVDEDGAPVLGRDTATLDVTCVLAILRAGYRIALCELHRVQKDLDLLVGIARAVEAGIYDPEFALERAAEHGLVAWLDAEVAP